MMALATFSRFLKGQRHQILKFTIRIIVLFPIFGMCMLLGGLWIALKIQGVTLSQDLHHELFSMAMKLTMLMTGASWVHMVWNQWDEHKKKNAEISEADKSNVS